MYETEITSFLQGYIGKQAEEESPEETRMNLLRALAGPAVGAWGLSSVAGSFVDDFHDPGYAKAEQAFMRKLRASGFNKPYDSPEAEALRKRFRKQFNEEFLAVTGQEAPSEEQLEKQRKTKRRVQTAATVAGGLLGAVPGLLWLASLNTEGAP